VDDTKLSGVVDNIEGCDSEDLDRLEDWSRVNLLAFNKLKCKVLLLPWGNSGTNTGWRMKGLRAALQRRACGYWWMKNWT